jgi:hypothetical protein
VGGLNPDQPKADNLNAWIWLKEEIRIVRILTSVGWENKERVPVLLAAERVSWRTTAREKVVETVVKQVKRKTACSKLPISWLDSTSSWEHEAGSLLKLKIERGYFNWDAYLVNGIDQKRHPSKAAWARKTWRIGKTHDPANARNHEVALAGNSDFQRHYSEKENNVWWAAA